MSHTLPARTPDVPRESNPGIGLRLRIWMGCLAGAMVAGGGMWWVIGVQTGPGPALDVPALVSWLAAVAALGVVVGAAFALWLDRGIVVQLRGLAHGVATGQVVSLRGLPAAAGWGELSQLTQRIQLQITHHRHTARAAEELGLVRDQLGVLREALQRWNDSELWTEVRAEGGPVGQVADVLNRAIQRTEEVREQNQEAARQVGEDLARALEGARESTTQAERGFIEATALLTTVRELQRLGAELAQATIPTSATEAADAHAAFRSAARGAIEELVAGSAQSVDQLARGLGKVQEIADQVALLANRATLIALNAAVGGVETRALSVDLAEDMKQLAAQVRAAMERTTQLTREIEADVTGASQSMRGVRQRVAERLDAVSVPAPPAATSATAEPSRLLERVREMIQDATQKGERLAAAAERVSRATDGIVRGLEEEVQEMKGMMVRLSPPEAPEPSEAAPPPSASSRKPNDPQGPIGLRLLGEEHLLSGEEPGPRRSAPGDERP